MPTARFLLQSLGLVAAGTGLGFALNPASPHPVSLSEPVFPAAPSAAAVCHVPAQAPTIRHRTMSQADAIQACQDCSVAFVDARGGAAFEQGHIPGAVHLPPEDHEDAPEVRAKLSKFETIVVYDADGQECHLAQGIADRLISEGFRDVRILEGSWTAWEAAQAPAQAGACEACGADRHEESR